MKIRTNFVSNSSSTSFCICGKVFNDINALEQHFDLFNFEHLDKIDLYRLGNLDIINRNDDYPYYIGLKINHMKYGETLLEFKQKVLDEINKYSTKQLTLKDINLLKGGWYDG